MPDVFIFSQCLRLWSYGVCHLILLTCTAILEENVVSGLRLLIQSDTKKRKLLNNPTKIEEIQKKKKLLTEIEP